jgi:hypothetical protein
MGAVTGIGTKIEHRRGVSSGNPEIVPPPAHLCAMRGRWIVVIDGETEGV